MVFYNLGIFLFQLLLKIASPFNVKARQMLEGRKETFASLLKTKEDLSNGILFHCASLGEFEQGRPLIEKLKSENHKIILTFFSPSGFEIRRNYKHADLVIYLPFDTKKNAKELLDKLKPKAIIVVKYDLWHHFLAEAKRRAIPMFLVSASFKKNFAFFKPYGGVFRKMLFYFDKIYVQDEDSKLLLEDIKVKSTVAGDTRIDRVLEIAKSSNKFPKVETFIAQKKCLIAGSTWPIDEELLMQLIESSAFENWKIIIAPHDVSSKHLANLYSKIKVPYCSFSELQIGECLQKKVLIVDNIGILSNLYQYADTAYIGGGFGQGIHNTLEPASFSLPILFGPKIQKFPEAVYLNKKGAALIVNDFETLKMAFEKLSRPEYRAKAKQEINKYLKTNKGASEKILMDFKKFVD